MSRGYITFKGKLAHVEYERDENEKDIIFILDGEIYQEPKEIVKCEHCGGDASNGNTIGGVQSCGQCFINALCGRPVEFQEVAA